MNEVISNMRKRIYETKKNLMPGPRLEELKKIRSEFSAYIKNAEEMQKSELEKIDSQAAQFKPKASVISDEELKENQSLFLVGNRKMDKNSVRKMNYLTKTVLSKLKGEVRNKDEYLSLMSELANSENEDLRTLFLDNYYDLHKAGESLEDFQSIAYKLRDLYKSARDNAKSPEELKYEESLTEADKKKAGLIGQHFALEKNGQEFSNELDSEIRFLSNQQ
jgi:hypothetical protein